MSSDLSVRERDLLKRLDDNEELRPLFFREARDLKWFDALVERDYFNPSQNPIPRQVNDEGYFTIPTWVAIEYLVKTAPQAAESSDNRYAKKILDIVAEATSYAKSNEVSNYRTWWQFSKIIRVLPSDLISLDQIEMVDYWLDDRFENGLVAEEIGEKWLPELLKSELQHNLHLANRILKILYKVEYSSSKYEDKLEAKLRIEAYHADRITNNVASLAGSHLKAVGFETFNTLLVALLEKLHNDTWSAIWQPAIEDHVQNKYHEDAQNFLIRACRDSLQAYIRVDPDSASGSVKQLLKSTFETNQRIALYFISRNYRLFNDEVEYVLNERFFRSNLRHEMWHFLNKCYSQFGNNEKEIAKELISSIARKDDDGNILDIASAYDRSIWFSAIKDSGSDELKAYLESTKIAGAVPEHPDFSSYSSVGWVEERSPISIEGLEQLTLPELVQELENYVEPNDFRESSLEGFVKVFGQLIKRKPLEFYLNLKNFSHLDLAYIHAIIETYSDLWNEKAHLPWDDIWQNLLGFCSEIVNDPAFWSSDLNNSKVSNIVDKRWVVSSIARLIEAGSKSDDHAFDGKFLMKAEHVLLKLLKNTPGNEFKKGCDAVVITLNSPRGQCLEALINLALRNCRIADKSEEKNHVLIWKHFQIYFDDEIKQAEAEPGNYEFVTLVAKYLPNFLYLSQDWFEKNLSSVFDQHNHMKWLCAMQGYAYANGTYQSVYDYLKVNGDLVKALDDRFLGDRIREKIIQDIALAYVNEFESFEDESSLINVILERNKYAEISKLIWVFWAWRKKKDSKLRGKVYDLWSRILKSIDFSSRDGRKLASQLCYWATFVDYLDQDRKSILVAIAPYADENHNSSELLRSLSNISEKQAFEAFDVWMKMLTFSAPDYPEEAIRKIFENLLKEGEEGFGKARQIESEYLKKENSRPSEWLKDIRGSKN